MKRLVYLAALVLFLSLPAFARQKLQGWCQDGGKTITVPGGTGPTTTNWQQSFSSCTVTVYDVGTTNLSTIYGDNSGTAKANPFTSAASGQWFFYADNARYDVKFSGGGISTPFTLGDFNLNDQAEQTWTYKSVTFSATPTFDASQNSLFAMTLTANVTSSTVSNAKAGRVIGFQLCQDATGGRTFAWPTAFLRPPTIASGVSQCTNATFFYDGTNWRELGVPGDTVRHDFQTHNNVRYADQFSGANAGAKIINCLADLPSTGGTCDAHGLEGAQSATSMITIGASQRLILGAVTLSSSASPVIRLTGSGSRLQGMAATALLTAGTVVKNTGSGNTIEVGDGVTVLRGFRIENLALDGNNTAAFGLRLQSAGNAVVDKLEIINHRRDGIRIEGGIDTAIRNGRITNGQAAIVAATGASRSANVVTITTTTAHNFAVNDPVQIRTVTDTSFNGAFTIASVPSSTTFTYSQTGANATSGSGTAEAGYGVNILASPITTTITLQQLYMTGYHTGLSNNGTNTVSIQCIYEYVTNGVRNSGNSFMAINDYFEGNPPFAKNYILQSDGMTTILSSNSSITTSWDISGMTDLTRINLIQAINGSRLGSLLPVGDGGTLGSTSLAFVMTGRTLTLQDNSGANQPGININNSGSVLKGLIAHAPSAGALTPGSLTGDLVIRAQTQQILFSPDGGTTTAFKIGSDNKITVGSGGTAIGLVKIYTPSLTPAAIAANTSAEQTFTVTGLATTDTVYVNPPSLTAGTGIVSMRVTAVDTLGISWGNFTSGSLTPPAGTYRIVAIRN